MNRLNLLLGIMVLSFLSLSCEKEEAETNNKSLIIGQWKLTGLVNVSDQYKYLNAVLEIQENNEYSNNEESGSEILNGIWTNSDNQEELNLSLGIFENYSVDYRIIKMTLIH